MDYQGDEPQEYEQVPWSHLVPVKKDRSLQLAVAFAVIVAVLLAIMYLTRRAPVAPIVASTITTPATAAEVASPGATAASTTVPPASVPGPQIYSEADLMAALPPQPELAAIARAEWFVTDYFTVDGDASLADEIAAVLPDAVDLPATDGSLLSYVEWARAVAVQDHRDGSYDVTVWFRTLVGNAAGGFDRTGVRAVDVRLVTDGRGRLAIADLPLAATVEPAGIAPDWPDASAAPPDTVAAAAEALAGLGEDPELIDAGRDEAGWRLVFSVGDASGLRFPVVVRVPEPGQ